MVTKRHPKPATLHKYTITLSALHHGNGKNLDMLNAEYPDAFLQNFVRVDTPLAATLPRKVEYICTKQTTR